MMNMTGKPKQLDAKQVKACENDLHKIMQKYPEQIVVRAYNRLVIWKREKRKLQKEIIERQKYIDQLKEKIRE